MGKPKVHEQVPVSAVEVKEELEIIKKRDGELTFRGNKVEEYLQQFTTVNKKQAQEMQDKLLALKIPLFKEQHANKIIDVMPKHLEELKVVLQGYTITVKEDQMKKILDIVAMYA